MRKIAIIAAGALAAGLLTTAGPAPTATAHTPRGSATCEGVWAEGTNYSSRDDNRVSVSVDGRTLARDFERSDRVELTIPQDGRRHTWAWSVTTSSQNPAYSASASGTIVCGELPPPPPPPKNVKAKVNIKKIDKCSCVKDRVKVTFDPAKVSVKKERLTRLKWRVTVVGKRAPNGAFYVLPNHWNGTAGYARTQVYPLTLTDKSCGPYTGEHAHWVATHNPCRSSGRGC